MNNARKSHMGRQCLAVALPAVIVAGLLVAAVALAADAPAPEAAPKTVVVKPLVTLMNDKVKDQDDMCFWRNGADPKLSTVITADKYRNKVFVYDLQGKLLQTVPVYKPGNIDSRAGFTLGGEKVDIVAMNMRIPNKWGVAIWKVDPKTRELVSIADDQRTGENYGCCLYHSAKTGKWYFFNTSKNRIFEQHELTDGGNGKVIVKKVRSWKVGFGEAAVADDASGVLYVAEEKRGIWAFPADPDPAKPEAMPEGKLIAKVGENGLAADVEGLTILPTGEKDGYLIASSQGDGSFKVYQRAAPNAFVGTFDVEGSQETDGIDVMAGGDFGPQFPEGVFACHAGADQKTCPVLLASWKDIRQGLGLK